MADLNSRQRIERDGFAGPFPRFAPDGLISELAEFFQDVLDHQPTHPLYNRYSVRDWHLVNASVRSLLTAPELVSTLQEATGADGLLLYGTEDANDTHCRRCGSLLYSVVRDGAYVHVAMGTLVDAPTVRPSRHIFVGSKAPWFTITDDLPQYEEHVVGTASTGE